MRTRFLGVFAVAAVLAGMASTASASELCTGIAYSGISDVTTIAAAGGCTVPGSSLLFDNFIVSATSGFTSVTVGISGPPALGTGVFGPDVDLAFQIGALEGPGVPDLGDIELAYTVTGGIIGLDLAVQASPVIPGGSLTVTEYACTAAFVGGVCSGTTLANLYVTSSGLPATNSEFFTTAYTGEVYILKDLSYDGATTSSLINSQIISAVPETATFSMMGAGLLGLGLVRRRTRK